MNLIVTCAFISFLIEFSLLLINLLIDRRRVGENIAYLTLTGICFAAALIVSNSIKVSEYTGIPVYLFSLEKCNQSLTNLLDKTIDYATKASQLNAIFAASEIVASVLSSFLSFTTAKKLIFFINTAKAFTKVLTKILSLTVALLLLLLLIIRFASRIGSYLLVTGSCLVCFRKLRRLGITLLSISIILLYVLPFTINSATLSVKYRKPEIEIPRNWSAVLFEVETKSGDHILYALIKLEFNYTIFVPCNTSNKTCCCCYACCPQNQTGWFTVQMNQYGKRIVILPEGIYCVRNVVVYWFNISALTCYCRKTGYNITGENCFPVHGKLGIIGKGPITDGVIKYTGPVTYVRIIVPDFDFIKNETGVYAFSYCFDENQEKIYPLAKSDKMIIYKKLLKPGEKIHVIVFGGSVKISWESTNKNLTVVYKINEIKFYSNITKVDKSFFKFLYKEYFDWWIRNGLNYTLSLFNESNAPSPEVKALIKELKKCKPEFFYHKPKILNITIIAVKNGTINETDYAVIWVKVLPGKCWNFTNWYYYNYYWTYFDTVIEEQKGVIGYINSLYNLLLSIFYNFIGLAIACDMFSGALGGYSVIASTVRRIVFYVLRKIPRTLSPGVHIGLRFKVAERITRSQFYKKLDRKALELTGRHFHKLPLRKQLQLIKTHRAYTLYRSEILTKISYIKSKILEKLSYATSASTILYLKGVGYTTRTGHIKLLRDITKSQKIDRIYQFLRKYPYGIREDLLKKASIELKHSYEVRRARKEILKIMRSPTYVGKVDLKYAYLAAYDLTKQCLTSLGLSSLKEIHRLYHTASYTGKWREAANISRVVAAVRVLEGKEHYRHFLNLDSRKLVLNISLQEALAVAEPLTKYYGLSLTPKDITQLMLLGDKEIENAYTIALAYAYARLAEDLFLQGYSEYEKVFSIQDKKEFVQKVAELASLEEPSRERKELEFHAKHRRDYIVLADNMSKLTSILEEINKVHTKQDLLNLIEEASKILDSLSKTLRVLIMDAENTGVDPGEFKKLLTEVESIKRNLKKEILS